MIKSFILKQNKKTDINESGIQLKKRRRHRSHRNRIFYRKTFAESEIREFSRKLSSESKSSFNEDESKDESEESFQESSIKTKSNHEEPNIRFETPDESPLLRSQATNLFQWILNQVRSNPNDKVKS